MMQPTKLFDNFFDAETITSTRLANFANDCLNRLTANNAGKTFDTLIGKLTPALTALHEELGEVDTTLNQRKGKTLTVDTFIEEFKNTMRNLYSGIAYKLGGEKTPGFLEFYPNGKSEYTNANKTELPTLLARITAATNSHKAVLDKDITDQLISLESNWNSSRNSQQQAKANVSDNLTDRTAARQSVENALLVVVHTIAANYPGNVQQCLAFFDFTMLEAKGKSSTTQPTPTPPNP